MELWVYADTPEGASLGRMDSTPEGVALRTVERYGEENSASGATLERVLRTVWRLCPSDGYGLLFFSHATGWLPEGGLQAPLVSRSIGLDQGSEMSLDAFVSAIPSGMPLDYVIFEACLMAGAEVALALAGHTDWVLASSAEVVEPGFRPLYAENLALLTDGGRPVEEQLAAFGQRYMAHVRTLSGTGCSATLSLIRTSSMPALAEAVRRVTRGFADEEGRDTPPRAFNTSTAREPTATVRQRHASTIWRPMWRPVWPIPTRRRPSAGRWRMRWCGAMPPNVFWAATAALTKGSISAATVD